MLGSGGATTGLGGLGVGFGFSPAAASASPPVLQEVLRLPSGLQMLISLPDPGHLHLSRCHLSALDQGFAVPKIPIELWEQNQKPHDGLFVLIFAQW